jgi:hypothetical protein
MEMITITFSRVASVGNLINIETEYFENITKSNCNEC